MPKLFNIAARARARRASLQAIYQWQMAASDLDELLTQYQDATQDKEFDHEYFQAIVTAVINQHAELDQQLSSVLDRAVIRLDPIERAICRLASYELANHLETPYRVVINEWVNLTKQFGATDGYKYVNAVIDKLAKTLRKSEYPQ